MARETKAQRDARLEAERLALVAVAKATYTERMMALLERATKENFELEVKNGLFKVEDRDERRRNAYNLQPTWTETADMDLYSLEVSVELKEEEREDRERVANLRATALAKLSEEERELLGL
jgi:hypothetical protein